MKLPSFTTLLFTGSLLGLMDLIQPSTAAVLESQDGATNNQEVSGLWFQNRNHIMSVKHDTVHPMPPNPNPYQVTYKDGTKSPMLRIKLYGDETDSSHAIWEETLDGFTVAPSAKAGGKYEYLDVDEKDGSLIETGLIAGIDDPSALNVNPEAAKRSKLTQQKNAQKHHIFKEAAHNRKRKLAEDDSSSEEIAALLESNAQARRRTTITSGTLKNLVVPFRFSDHTGRSLPSKSDLTILMNNEGPNALCPTGSVRDAYLESSFNQIDIQSTVADWVTLDYTEASCAAGNSGLVTSFHTCLTNALDKVVANGVDFSDYDLDNDGYIDGITFFHSGYAAEFGGTDSYGTFYSNRIWSHKWAIWTTNWSNNGVRVYEYHVNPSLYGTSGSSIGRIGVVAHETGHFLGLPDLYDYGDATYGDGEGIGSYGLMANSWGFQGNQYYPPLMSAWSKYKLGWVTPTEVSSSGSFSLGQACDNPDMLIISAGFPSGEYLLIENRQPCGFETAMYQGGIAIFHIDDNANNIRGYPGQSGWPTNGNHYEVALLQADGSYGLEQGYNRGDSTDLFHAGGVNSIGPSGTSDGSSYPNTNAYQGGSIIDTEITISNISAAGSTMTLDITIGSNPGTPAPTPSPTSSPTPGATLSTSSPSTSQTGTPTASPTSSPTSSTSSSNCVDTLLRIRFSNANGDKISRSCDWVARKKTNARCALTGVSESCPFTCGTCSICVDPPSGQDLRFRFENTDGSMISRSCDWVARKQVAKRCGLTDNICRSTCGVC